MLKAITISNLGKNPKKGGIPPKESTLKAIIILVYLFKYKLVNWFMKFNLNEWKNNTTLSKTIKYRNI